MTTPLPVVVFNGLGVNVSSAKALIEEYDRELSEVEALITRVEDDKRKNESKLRWSKKAMRLQLQRQMDELLVQESIEVEQLKATLQARRAPLNEKRKSLLAKIDGLKNTIAPIRNIPAEILGYIFRDVVALGVAPWLLTIVNKTWRRAALRNPWLWSNIRVGGIVQDLVEDGTLSQWLVDGIWRFCDGNRLVCQNLDEFANFADKAGVVPLELWVYSQVKQDECEVLKYLFGPKHSSRIQSLSIYISQNIEETTGWIMGPLPLLQNLSCGSTQGPLIEQIMAKAHQLKNLTATSLSSALPNYRFWNTLRVLNFSRWAYASELNPVISQLRLVEAIEGIPTGWPDTNTPVVTLNHIKSISLTCHLQHIARLRLPQLEKLVWSHPHVNANFAEKLDFSKDPNWGLSFPSLIVLEARATGDAFVLALKELPNLHAALLTPIHSKNSKDPWALDLIRSLNEAEDMLCPRLRHLTLRHLKANKTLAKPLIRRLIVSRNALGIPFKHFKIAWAKRSGKAEEAVQYAFT